MKKAITILAVLIVLVGAVFADETHKIQIKSEVGVVLPIFQLSFVSGGTGTATTNASKKTYENGVPSELTIDGDGAITVDDISQNELSVVFEARLLSNVKLAESAIYDLQFVANPLTGEATGYQVSPLASASSVDYSANDLATRTTYDASYYDQHAAYTNSFVAEKTAIAETIIEAPASAGQPYAKKVTQTTMVAFRTENVTAGSLGQFTVGYPQDTAAPADTYKAYIELNITVE